MKHPFVRSRRALFRCLAVSLVSVLLLCTCGVVAFADSLWGAVPTAETQPSEASTQPLGSTSVGSMDQPTRDIAPAVSYGLRVLAAREELVFTGLCGGEISFTAEDFCRAMNLSELDYVTVQRLPSPGEGTLFVGSVGAAEGQVISAGSLSLLSFAAADDTIPSEATMMVSVNGSDYTISCRLCLLDRLNYTPTVALAPTVSLHIETYKGLPTAGSVSAYDPEGDELTYEIVRYATHGRVSLTDRHTGAYVYTPDTGYVGQDSFDYVVYDRYGNYSTSATVSVTVTPRPTVDAYADLDGRTDTAAILAVSSAGLMNGTRVGDEVYFKPDEAISRVELLVTAMRAAGITATDAASAKLPAYADAETIPVAMRPYVAYAAEQGYIGGKAGSYLNPHASVTRAEAAVILSNIIGYAVEDTVTAFADAASLPKWSGDAFTSLRALGILDTPDGNARAGEIMTRATTALWLNRAMRLMGA